MTLRESPCGCPTGVPPAAVEGTPGDTAPCAGTDRSHRKRAWAELLRLPALFSVPGDGLAGAAATRVPPDSRTQHAIASSL
ncbi:prenyltransferase, partial [Streptomyces sp. NPDC006265]